MSANSITAVSKCLEKGQYKVQPSSTQADGSQFEYRAHQTHSILALNSRLWREDFQMVNRETLGQDTSKYSTAPDSETVETVSLGSFRILVQILALFNYHIIKKMKRSEHFLNCTVAYSIYKITRQCMAHLTQLNWALLTTDLMVFAHLCALHVCAQHNIIQWGKKNKSPVYDGQINKRMFPNHPSQYDGWLSGWCLRWITRYGRNDIITIQKKDIIYISVV